MNKELQTMNYIVFALTAVVGAAIIMMFVQGYFMFCLKKAPVNRK